MATYKVLANTLNFLTLHLGGWVIQGKETRQFAAFLNDTGMRGYVSFYGVGKIVMLIFRAYCIFTGDVDTLAEPRLVLLLHFTS